MGRLLKMVALAAGLLMLLLGWPNSATHAAEIRGQAAEYDLKAAFVFNFTQFVEWPTNSFTSTNSPFVIGLLGPDPFGGALDRIVTGEQVRGHPIQIERFSRVGDLRPVHLLFISRAAASQSSDTLTRLANSPTLTVSDIDRFAERGGMIQLAVEQGRIRMRIDAEAAQRAGLNISSKLLRLAQPARDAAAPRGGAR